MSVQKQFKRQGERMTAAFLWSIIFGLLFTKIGRRILLVLIIIGGIVWFVSGPKDGPYKGYVHNRYAFCDKPYGSEIKGMQINDTLTILGGETEEEFQKVLYKGDTIYTRYNTVFGTIFFDGCNAKPFTKWDALEALSYRINSKKQKDDLIVLNNPKNEKINMDDRIKDGTKLVFYSYSDDTSIEVRKASSSPGGTRFRVPLEQLRINWKYVKKKFPRAIY
ncbi:hypothetical protein K4L44_04680 [Halosquirtibacter laminarini]|uniref:Uncharacterized protein n=1 Tax=Halosquirtibacter laminarini TaxID=3374600 RepID=A0AC61NHI8_9BACT|nr:hypothetical protein K4L44_04680 [Prolixibacteraceae bacterium]